jgi:uncharacterized membrane protein YdjX (TVP38/TMEM64 family)
MDRATSRQLLGVATLLAVAAAAALVLSPAALLAALTGLADRPLRLALALTAVYLVRPFLLWPVTLLAVAVGYLYGPVVGVPVALLGTGLSNLPPFLLARRTGADAGLLAPLAGTGRRLVGTVGDRRGVLAARLLPLPGDAVSYGAGLARVPPGAFLVWTVVGELPWATAAVLTGHSMRSFSASAVRFSPELVVAAAGAAVLILAGPVYGYLANGAGQ